MDIDVKEALNVSAIMLAILIAAPPKDSLSEYVQATFCLHTSAFRKEVFLDATPSATLSFWNLF